MAKHNKKPQGATDEQAAVIHALLADLMEAGLRQQLMSGEIDNTLIRNVITYLNNNNITVSKHVDSPLSSLADMMSELDIDGILDSSSRG